MWRKTIEGHYCRAWGAAHEICPFSKGPVHELPQDFCVLKFPPRAERSSWTYATCCMSTPEDDAPIELHMVSSVETGEIVELLYMTAHFHRTGARLGLGHTVNFGRPWIGASACDHALVSLPYLDGPKLEVLNLELRTLRFYWLLPVTRAERDFKVRNGLEALEQEFELAQLDYANPNRRNVV